MPSFTMAETESSSSGSGRMERIRPEKIPRQRVQKIWRNVRWANAFPDEALSMEVVDITPNFALRKIALLFETKKYDECASLIRRLNYVALENILQEIPIEVLHDSMPSSLSILEALYVKIYETSSENFPKRQLCMDQMLKHMVAWFAKCNSLTYKAEKNCNTYYPSCRNILRVILFVEPHIKQQLRQKMRALDKCLRHLGQHGLVDSSDGHLMNLHDALKLEFDKVISQYRNALQKLDELSLSTKHPTSSTVTSGKAPSEASHQRLMQLNRTDVQSRIIKNKTLYNIVEPAITNQYLKKLILILERRIDYDKLVLFHDTELKKFLDSPSNASFLSLNLRHFSQGYKMVLQLLKDVSDETDGMTTDDEGAPSSDEEITSPVTNDERMKSLSRINGFIPFKGGNGGSTSRGTGGRRGIPGLRPSIISGPFPFRGETNGLTNGHGSVGPRSYSSMSTLSLTNGHSENNIAMETLEQEVQKLQLELKQSQDLVKQLKEREKQLMDRLSEHAQQQFSNNNSHFEDLNLGESRPTELIRIYGNLYSEGRMEALDALDSMSMLGELSVLKEKILFSVIVLSFRATQQAVHELRGKLRHLLNLPHPDPRISSSQDPLEQQMEKHIDHYLSRKARKFDVTHIIQEVCSQIYATLYDYPCLKDCVGLQNYIATCVRTAWGLSVQNPAYFIAYDTRKFQNEFHTRFHTSDANSEDIKSFLWPALTEGYNGECVQKAVVIT